MPFYIYAFRGSPNILLSHDRKAKKRPASDQIRKDAGYFLKKCGRATTNSKCHFHYDKNSKCYANR